MALFSRISDFLDRFFDPEPSEGADIESAEGFLMNTPELAPPVLPSLARAADAPPEAAPRQSRAQSLPPVPAPVGMEAPALAPPGQARPGLILVPAQPAEDDEPADESIDGPAASDEPVPDNQPAVDIDPPATIPAPAAAQPLSEAPESPPAGGAEAHAAPALAVSSVTASEPPSDGPRVESADDMLSMFRDTAVASEFTELTKDLEDVTAQELLTEARAVHDLIGAQPIEDDAA
jgi:hypothetical protein